MLYEVITNYEYVLGGTVGGLAIADFYNLKNSVSSPTSANIRKKRATNSLFGNVSVGWKSMMYLEGSLRNDWSSTLPDGNNSYT